MPYNSGGEWIEKPSIKTTNLTTKSSNHINKPKVIPYNSDVCSNDQLNIALRYDIELCDLYVLLFKSNSSRTWYNKFRLDESGLSKRLNLFYNILLSRFSNFGISVANILRKYNFYEYCYFQALKNIYIIIKKKYSTNVINIFSSIDDAILKVYLFFLVKYFNDYISQYKNMLETIGNRQKKAIKINNSILNNKYNKTYNSIINKSIRELNNRGSTIQENYEPYKNCIIFYERFYKVYNSLSIFLYENSYDIVEGSEFYMSIQKLKNRIDKLHYLLVETVTGRIERNEQRKLEREQLHAEHRKYHAELPKSVPSWTNGLNQRELHSIGEISNNDRKKRQQEHLNSVTKIKQEEENQQIISTCSTPGITVDPIECNKAYARQRERNYMKAAAKQRFIEEYEKIHGISPQSDPYQGH